MDQARSYQLKVDDEIRDDEHFTDYIGKEDSLIPLQIPHHGDNMRYWSYLPTSANVYNLGAGLWAHRDPVNRESENPVGWTPSRSVTALKAYAHAFGSLSVYAGNWPPEVVVYGDTPGTIAAWQQPVKTKAPALVELAVLPLQPDAPRSGVMENTITEAAWITELEEDWDQQGAKRIKVPLFNTAAVFLRTYDKYLGSVGKQLIAPEINPCPDGSIDLSWRTAYARLLININEREGVTYANFYGDKFNDRFQFKGQTEANEFFESLASWMKFISK